MVRVSGESLGIPASYEAGPGGFPDGTGSRDGVVSWAGIALRLGSGYGIPTSSVPASAFEHGLLGHGGRAQ